MTFNDKIDLYMKNKNYSNLKQLAEACEIPYTTLRDFYEKKSADNSRLSTIRKLSNFMGCSMDYLAYDDVTDFNGYLVDTFVSPKIKQDNELDNLLFSKAKELNDEEKQAILQVMNAIHKDIDKELDN